MAAVQPCALLLVVGPDWSIATASTNLAMIGAGDADAVIGTPLADLIGSDSIHSLRNRVSWLAGDDSEVQDFGVEWGTAKVDVRALREDDTIWSRPSRWSSRASSTASAWSAR